MLFRTKEITARQAAIAAERGLHAARLNGAQLSQLAHEGLGEIDTARAAFLTAPTPLTAYEMNLALSCIPRSSHERLVEAAGIVSVTVSNLLEASLGNGWMNGSPAFALRDGGTTRAAFRKVLGKYILHLEIATAAAGLATVNLRLTDPGTHDAPCAFEAELFENGRCVESVATGTDLAVGFPALSPKSYILRILDNCEVIETFELKLCA